MNPSTRRTRGPARSVTAATELTWQRQWDQVPQPWRSGQVRLDLEPFNEVFVRNTNYLRSVKEYTFAPGASVRAGQEVSWWLWSIWTDGSRKIDPAMLAWWSRAVDRLAVTRGVFNSADCSVADFDPALVVREAIIAFRERNQRDPSPGNVRNLRSCASSIYQHITIRCTDQPWWTHQVWDLRLDPRIPRRPHEPHADRAMNLAGIEPVWLREGIRFWLSRAILTDQYTWTTACTRVVSVGTLFGEFVSSAGIEHPAVADGLPALREVFMNYLAALRAPRPDTGKPLAATGVAAAQSAVQRFYEFMLDNSADAATFTADPRWKQLTTDHARLWPATRAGRRVGNQSAIRYYTSAELSAMLAYLPVLAAATTDTVTVEHADTVRTFSGLGDPQAARAWLIQSLTGRRASEILMCDHDPLTMLDLGGDIQRLQDPDAFVARLRYQQTKVDDVDPTILVEQAVVTVIREQQAWVADHLAPGTVTRYLFLQPRGNYRGLNPRSYRSYADALKRLDKRVALTGVDGKPLRFGQTHRLRHTRATELLNGGVAEHVVQRYLGHKSPEMTMRYAQTLAQTAEQEFLRHKKIGADGRDLKIATRDLIDLAALDKRADRILPNGLCLLPPTQTCDKGNACLPCGSFATDRTHLSDHRQQHARIAALIHTRQQQYQARHGQPMPTSNVWLIGRQRELASLVAIIERLEHESDPLGNAVSGAGTSSRSLIPVELVTNQTHRSALAADLTSRLQQP